MNRRYHVSPSIAFHIAHAHGLQEPVGSPVSAMNGLEGIGKPPTTQGHLEGSKTASRVFVISMLLAGVAIGAGVSLELNGVDPVGLFVQASGFLLAVVSVYRHPEEDES